MKNPYSFYHERKGVRPVSWEMFHGLCKGLAQAASGYDPEIILAVARGGLYPGTLIAHLLRAELYPIRLTRREADVVVRAQPQWSLRPPESVKGKRVLVVDEISGSGETLSMVREACLERGAAGFRSAVLYAHTSGIEVPDYIGLISDELLLNPWDREIWKDGSFGVHPEYEQALKMQGLSQKEIERYRIEAIKPVKTTASD
jgi:uncharacterized protein